MILAGGNTGWLGRRRRSWWQPVALFLGGSVVDATLAPSGTLVGPTLVAIWCGLTAPRHGEAAILYVVAAVFTATTVASLAGVEGFDLARQGSVARSAALGVLLVTLGLLGARRSSRRSMGRAGLEPATSGLSSRRSPS